MAGCSNAGTGAPKRQRILPDWLCSLGSLRKPGLVLGAAPVAKAASLATPKHWHPFIVVASSTSATDFAPRLEVIVR